MEKDILDGKIGEVGAYDLEFKGGFLQFKLGINPGYGVEVDLVAKISSDSLMDALAKAIPGQVDDAFFAVVKTALKM